MRHDGPPDPTRNGASDRSRTYDKQGRNLLLCPLSYRGMEHRVGLEPTYPGFAGPVFVHFSSDARIWWGPRR